MRGRCACEPVGKEHNLPKSVILQDTARKIGFNIDLRRVPSDGFSLSFLGLGIQPPYSDWGGLVGENIAGLSAGAPAVIIPEVAIAILTVATNLLIDNLPGRKVVGDGR